MTLSMVDRYDTPTGVDAELVTESVAGDGPRLPLAAPVLGEAAAREAARRAVADLMDKRALDAVLEQVKGDGLRLTGPARSPRCWYPGTPAGSAACPTW